MKKIFSIFAAATVAMMTTFSCTKVDTYEDTTNPLPVTEADGVELQGLEISPKTSYVVIGEPVYLEVGLVPENAHLDKVTWTSSDESVATVDAFGNVTTLAKGVARITASYGDQSATALVNVFAERVPATEIVLNKSEINLLVGRATKVKATLLPAETTDKQEFEWKSSNESVATVSYGFIQAVGLGEATITASQNGLSASCKVVVADKIKLVDRSEVWPITDTPKWDKNWNGQITGSHEDVTVSDFDGEYAYFGVVAADKFTSIEDIANTVYEQVEERKDAGQDPRSLFGTGETQTKQYSDMGDAVAYVLGYDSEFEFTGEYSLYRFVAREPDPVHATGIQFSAQSGWNYSPVSSLEIKEGKSTRVQLSLLPEDCTDTGSISLEPADASMLKVDPYYPQYYSNQFTISALAEGKTKLIAKFNDVVSELEVTITGGSIVWTNRSNAWSGEWGMGLYYGYYECFGFTLNSCTSSSHLIVIVNASEISGDPATYYRTVASQNEGNLSWYASSDIPEFSAYSWNDKDDTIERYAYVFGVSSGDYDGNYAIFHYDPNGGSVDPGPGPQPQDGKVVNLTSQYFPVDFSASDKDQDNVTMEAWVNPSSFSGSNDNIYTVMGTEGIFLLRFEGSQLNLVYGGAKRTGSNEYNEKKVTYSTNFSTGEWHHIAATYAKGGSVILYVDGEKVGENTAENHGIELNGVGAQWVLPFKFYVGVSSNNRYFKGNLAEMRVWKKVRSASEIKADMNKSIDTADGLLASWHFNEGSGNTVSDASGNGYDLTANGTLSWEDGTRPF